jgi:hypothetical protein
VGRIEVTPSSLRSNAAQVATVAGGVSGLAGAAHLGAAGAPDATIAALEHFGAGWGHGLTALGGTMRSLGVAVDAAGAAYETTDASSMPARP